VEVTRKVVDRPTLGVTVEGELGCLGSLETMQGDKEDGHGTDAIMTRRATADRAPALILSNAQLDRAGDRYHQPRRVQVHSANPRATFILPSTACKSTAACPTPTW
jgi:hypothetical protein